MTFSGAGINGGSLADGNYRLRVLNAAVVDSAGQHLDGSGDGVADGETYDDAVLAFYRFFGDIDGDRDVDAADSFRFRQAAAGTPVDPGDLSAFDFDGDGDLDLLDLLLLRLNLNRRLNP